MKCTEEMTQKIQHVIKLAMQRAGELVQGPEPLDSREAAKIFSDIHSVEDFAQKANADLATMLNPEKNQRGRMLVEIDCETGVVADAALPEEAHT